MVQINWEGFYYPKCLMINRRTLCFSPDLCENIVEDFAHAINFLSEHEIDAEAKLFLYYLIKFQNPSMDSYYQSMLDIFHQHFRLQSRKHAKSVSTNSKLGYCLHYFDIDTGIYQFTKKCYSKRETQENKGDIYFYVLRERLIPARSSARHPKYVLMR